MRIHEIVQSSFCAGRRVCPPPTGAAIAQQAYGNALNLELARKCIAAAETDAKKNNWAMAITIVDDGGHLMAFARLDNTQIASIRISIDKARAANKF